MQDLLDKDATSRMNVPSTVGGNWEWRMLAEDLTEERKEFLKNITVKIFEREGIKWHSPKYVLDKTNKELSTLDNKEIYKQLLNYVKDEADKKALNSDKKKSLLYFSWIFNW